MYAGSLIVPWSGVIRLLGLRHYTQNTMKTKEKENVTRQVTLKSPLVPEVRGGGGNKASLRQSISQGTINFEMRTLEFSLEKTVQL